MYVCMYHFEEGPLQRDDSAVLLGGWSCEPVRRESMLVYSWERSPTYKFTVSFFSLLDDIRLNLR